MNISNRKLELQLIEEELNYLIKNDRKNWIRTAKLLHQIEKEKLFEVRTVSFTRYVMQLAEQNKINVSTLWRAKTAANVYIELLGYESISEIKEEKVKTTPEQLETYNKIRTIAPEKIVEEVKLKLLEGEGIRNELHALWKTYRPLKKGKTERGRKSKQSNKESLVGIDQYHLPFDDEEILINKEISDENYGYLLKDIQKLEKYNLSTEDLTKGNIKNALRGSKWVSLALGKFNLHHFNPFYDIAFKNYEKNIRYKFDFIGIVKKDKKLKSTPILMGVIININPSSHLLQKKLEAQSTFFNYYYLAIPLKEDTIRKAIENTPKSLGIIAIGKETDDGTRHELKLVRKSEFNHIENQNKAIIYQKLLENNLGW
ncbi:MAG: hypothetical protein KTR26_05205 [Flammeovirgaceae bacterium]|nr:hypothetical protein [Flammeovirgaceae bacterium]